MTRVAAMADSTISPLDLARFPVNLPTVVAGDTSTARKVEGIRSLHLDLSPDDSAAVDANVSVYYHASVVESGLGSVALTRASEASLWASAPAIS